jgi:hypothetical protein
MPSMQKGRFESYSKEFQLLANTLPMLISVTKNPNDETREQFIVTHDRFLTLGDVIKDKLAALETATIIQTIGNNYNLVLVQISDIARAIRSYYFGELKLEDMPFVLAKEMNVDLTKAKEITQVVLSKIINDDSQEKAYAATLENLLIPEMLKKYPESGEQLITSNRIKLKSFPDLARPSLKNWLTDYAFNLGQGTHTAIQRGNYLFQTENTKTLSAFDRNRLNYILKSLDENTPVTISKNTQQLIFPKSETSEIPTQQSTTPTRSESKANIQSVQFSYPQKSAFERKPQSFNKPISQTPIPNRNLGPNVVNLKD